MKKRWTLLSYDSSTAQHLQEVLKINPIFCQMLAQRGISTYDEAYQFFRPSLEHLHDPFLMKGMDLAVNRLASAIQRKEKVLLYGDYDVDGTTSVALMFSFLKNIIRIWIFIFQIDTRKVTEFRLLELIMLSKMK